MEHMADPGRIGSSCVLILTVLFSIDALSRPLGGSWSTWLILVEFGSSCVLVLTVLSIDALSRPLRGSWRTWLILVGLGFLVFSF